MQNKIYMKSKQWFTLWINKIVDPFMKMVINLKLLYIISSTYLIIGLNLKFLKCFIVL